MNCLKKRWEERGGELVEMSWGILWPLEMTKIWIVWTIPGAKLSNCNSHRCLVQTEVTCYSNWILYATPTDATYNLKWRFSRIDFCLPLLQSPPTVWSDVLVELILVKSLELVFYLQRSIALKISSIRGCQFSLCGKPTWMTSWNVYELNVKYNSFIATWLPCYQSFHYGFNHFTLL